MLIPGFVAVKVQSSDDFGRLTIFRTVGGERDKKVFSIDSDGDMHLSDSILECAREMNREA